MICGNSAFHQDCPLKKRSNFVYFLAHCINYTEMLQVFGFFEVRQIVKAKDVETCVSKVGIEYRRHKKG